MITDPNDVLVLMHIEKEQLEGRVNEFDRSLGNYRAYNCSIDSYNFYIKDMPRSIVLLSLPHHSTDYSKTFDKLQRHYALLLSSYLCSLTYTCLRCMHRLMISSSDL